MRISLSALAKKLEISDSILIGITGVPGSGQTTLSKRLSSHLSKLRKDYRIIHIDGDLYLKDSRDAKMKKVSKMRSYKDYWDVFQIKQLGEDIENIRHGIPFERKRLYSRETGELNETLQMDFLDEKNIFIISGMQIVHPKLLPHFDKIIFLDIDPKLCLKRKRARATYRTPEETVSLFKNFEEPLFSAYKDTLLKLNGKTLVHLF